MITPTEEMLEAARAAGAVDAAQEFWTEVADRLDEYGADKTVSARQIKE